MHLKKLSKSVRNLLLVSALAITAPALANNKLPEIGTAGVSALSIEQEKQYGDAFIKVARSSFPIVNDPILKEYLSDIGGKLITQSNAVRFPFHFFLVKNDEINAAAFLGGYVKVHTGLFLYADNESEFASVLAHEISHITQRHLARSLEAQASNTHLTLAGVIGAVLLSLADPTAGLAMLQTTVAANAQASINYTRANEFEADRIGIQLMANAGYDPAAMSSFFDKLAAQYRFSSTPPQMLITHPLPDTRITEARDRATLYPHRYFKPSLPFQLAKARIQVRYGTMGAEDALSYFDHQLKTKKFAIKEAALYGKALALNQLKKNPQAKEILASLAAKNPDNLFYLDSLTDVDLALGNTQIAIARLQKAAKKMSGHQVITLNLAVALKQNKQYDEATQLLRSYLQDNSTDTAALGIYIDLLKATEDTVNMYIAMADYATLVANYPKALNNLRSARALATSESAIARIDAQIEQVKAEQIDMETLQN